METNNEFPQKTHMTEECHAHLGEKVNKQNFGTINDLIEKQQEPCSKSLYV